MNSRRWQFSLRTLMLVMTFLAMAVALAANRPWWAAAIGCVLVPAAALHFADRMIAVSGARFLRRITTLLWMTIGILLCLLGAGALVFISRTSLSTNPLMDKLTWLIAVPIIAGGLSCFYAARHRSGW